MALAATFARPKRLLDLLEQLTVLVLYTWLVMRLWPAEISLSNWYPILLVLSEGLVVVLLLVRKPTDRISVNGLDWMVAAGGTFAVLLVGKGGTPIYAPFGAFLILTGLVVHVGAKLSLRRSFGVVAANRGIKIGGFYRLVRHPMYAGYMLTHIGYLFVAPSAWNLAVYAGAWAFLIARIYAEERVLSEDPEYREFKSRVRFRLLPGVF